MRAAAADLEFEEAARLRDEIAPAGGAGPGAGAAAGAECVAAAGAAGRGRNRTPEPMGPGGGGYDPSKRRGGRGGMRRRGP